MSLLLSPVRPAWAQPGPRKTGYGVDVGILYDAFTFRLPGTIEESVDRDAGRYEVRAFGDGGRIKNQLESRGILRRGRWSPTVTTSAFDVAGRVSRGHVIYDHDRGMVEYHFRGETFFLRRQRVVDDMVAIPDGAHVDDAMSAILNYADDRWPREPGGTLRTHVVRRHRPEREGVDDVQPSYRAEIVPLDIRLSADPASGQTVGEFDLGRFSSWAVRGKPGRVVFGRDRRPVDVTAALALGTSVTIHFQPWA